MSVGRKGLRHAGGTDITKCCGREAMIPVDEDDCRRVEPYTTNDGTAITESNFPDAELVCPECERTWGDGCEHDDVSVYGTSVREFENDSAWAFGHCNDCDSDVNILLEITDIREVHA